MGRFPWDSHRNDIPMDKSGNRREKTSWVNVGTHQNFDSASNDRFKELVCVFKNLLHFVLQSRQKSVQVSLLCIIVKHGVNFEKHNSTTIMAVFRLCLVSARLGFLLLNFNWAIQSSAFVLHFYLHSSPRKYVFCLVVRQLSCLIFTAIWLIRNFFNETFFVTTSPTSHMPSSQTICCHDNPSLNKQFRRNHSPRTSFHHYNYSFLNDISRYR